ncbi:Prophage maintenance system killer protein (Doc) [Fructobacillus cardui]|uniref:type II toxin-antitoxin system death-on-curing family toxin n=1 Tax=Fructobacillus cardui TaxID=2893170 RepID=UPI001436FE3D|nr:MAG: hypothetical protein [Caudoviricetes sp.]CAK1229927.1 Prophage maintenance system killer protein (Doc) [Fructobacillus cardui]
MRSRNIRANGALIYANDNRKQLEEFKYLLARSGLLDGTGRIDIKTEKRKGYRILKIYSEGKVYRILVKVINTNYFDIEYMVRLNERAEKMFKEDSHYGLKDRNGLDQLLALMKQYTFGREYHPTIIDKAAYIWYSIATKQLFHNGNKRTALLAGFTFLERNLIELHFDSSQELYDLSVEIAEGKVSEKQLRQYIKENSTLNFEVMSYYNERYDIFRRNG